MHAIRLLQPADIPALLELCRLAGWNQTAGDWRRILELEAGGCFGIETDGRIVASATAIRYGRALAWIGMVLTHPEYRGRGLARRLMEHTLEWLRLGGCDCVKLDATEMGKPLYRSLGFVEECTVERWLRPASPLRPAPQSFAPAPPSLSLDAEAFGADRSRLLLSLAAEEAAVAAAGDYAMGRPGRLAYYLGPCVARSADTARGLIADLAARHSHQDLCWDLFPGHAHAARLAREFGFAPQRTLARMSLQPCRAAVQPRYEWIYAIAGFEYG